MLTTQNSFLSQFLKFSWEEISLKLSTITESDVRNVLNKNEILTPEDFLVLIAPVAANFVEEMAQKSFAISRKRFGNTMQLYAPLYLSNECQNVCTYCGFSFTNKIPRKTLSNLEIIAEASVLKSMGFDHVLLVTGEANTTVGVPYLLNAIQLLKPYFSNISIEVQPLDEAEYRALIDEGIYSVLVYQETYRQETYKHYHPKGKKTNFEYRLDTPDRIGRAGVHKIGLGALLGLEDWRIDSFFTALHLAYLEKTYWQTKFSVSFPRMRPFEGGEFEVKTMSERDLVQLICAWRIYREHLELSLSTRERDVFRDAVFPLGITTMSAGSKTEPGGYTAAEESLEQFKIDDDRSPKIVSEMLKSKGFDPVWKDWEQWK